MFDKKAIERARRARVQRPLDPRPEFVHEEMYTSARASTAPVDKQAIAIGLSKVRIRGQLQETPSGSLDRDDPSKFTSALVTDATYISPTRLDEHLWRLRACRSIRMM